ncbi:hypothetical protein AB0E69_22455 [Kribbella sp. NPDC026611]|uniref:hypothetical protein n=1 Tax=Kribbella sp. NPDC026611 TaxID=3154911 RepID=UPI0033C67563
MTNRLTKTVTILTTAALLACAAAAFGAVHRPTLSEAAVTRTSTHASRGSVVSAVRVGHATAAQLDAAAVDLPGTPHAIHDVTLYRLIYRTIDHDNRPITASGLVVLPDGQRGALTATEYLHGSTSTKALAPSVDLDSDDALVPEALFAGQGLVSLAPDYLGLGLGPGLHPYLDTKTETTASIDLLLAARSFTTRHGVTLKRDVLVTGFSQGGRATLGVGRALSRGEAGPFRLGELRAVAGPFDLLRTELPAALDGRVLPQAATAYLAHFVTAWDRTVGLYDKPEDAFRKPYAAKVEGLFDGLHTPEEISGSLPDSPDKLFTPAFLAQLKHPGGRYLRALQEADAICHDWTPRVPVHLYSGTEDTTVIPANADVCAAAFRSRGAEVTVHSMGPVDHVGTAGAAYPEIIRAFGRWA